MAHELSTDINQEGDVFSVRQSMWHSMGTILPEAPTLLEGMEKAGHLFTVGKKPIFVPAGPADYVDGSAKWSDDYVEVPTHFATYREDNGRILGVVGDRYHVLQNLDGFSVLEPLIDAGIARLETGGTLRGGQDVWMLVDFDFSEAAPGAAAWFAENGVKTYAAVINNHSGRRVVQLLLTPIRIVCANTLRAALFGFKGQQQTGKAVGVPHTKNVKSATVQAAIDLFGGIAGRFDTLATQYQALKAAKLDAELFEQLVLKAAAPLPTFKPDALSGKISARQETSVEQAKAKRVRINELWTAGKGHTGDHSAWEALNGLIESIDHDTDMWKTRGDRLVSQVDGSLGEIKQAVTDNLIRHALTVAA